MTPLFLQEQGSGKPIVFIHGFCETHEIWKEFITPFITSYRVITLDLPGFGNSELLSTQFTIDTVGDAVAETLEYYDIPMPQLSVTRLEVMWPYPWQGIIPAL